jgi:sugar-specific transcriptional regulator TrmB
MEYGLTEKQAEVYLFITKAGPCKASEISRALKIRRTEVYRIINDLQSLNVVESTLNFPTKFISIPIEDALDHFIKLRKYEINHLQELKEAITNDVKKFSLEKIGLPDRFMVIKNLKHLYLKISKIFRETKESIKYLGGNRDISYLNYRGAFEILGQKKGIDIRLLTELTSKNLSLLRNISNIFRNCKIKHVNESENLPQFIIKDDKEILIYLSAKTSSNEDIGLWTNNFALTTILSNFFSKIWLNAIDMESRINWIETGKPLYETLIIKDPELAYEKYKKITHSARKEIIRITTAMGVCRTLKNLPLDKLMKRGVKIYCLAPVTEKNVDEAIKLSKYCQIRHIDLPFLRIIIVDNKHLFQIKTPKSAENDVLNPLTHFDNMLYSNDEIYVKNMRDFIDMVWDQAIDLESRIVQLINKKDTVTDLKLIK